jgi:prepilin-type N-terminal cleavage/methylation domain-containing protein
LEGVHVTNTNSTHIREHGFTLIELLVVIGILAILLAITLIAINPNKHFQDGRNAERRSDVAAIVDAVYQYEASNSGNLPAPLSLVTSTPTFMALSTAQTATGTSFASPNLTFSGLTGNTVAAGDIITVTGCTQAGDNGTWPVTSATATTIVATDAGGSATSATGCSIKAGVNFCSILTPTYIADIPDDPTTGSSVGGNTSCAAGTTSYTTGYKIATTSGRITVSAPSAEGGASISVTR